MARQEKPYLGAHQLWPWCKKFSSIFAYVVNVAKGGAIIYEGLFLSNTDLKGVTILNVKLCHENIFSKIIIFVAKLSNSVCSKIYVFWDFARFIFSNISIIVSFDSIADLFLAKTIDYIVLIFDFLHFNNFLNTSLKRRCM